MHRRVVMRNGSTRRVLAAVLTGALFVLLTALGAGPVAADGNTGYAGGLDSQSPPPPPTYYPPGYTYPVSPYPYYAPAYAPAYAPVYGYPPAPVYTGGCAGYCGYTAAGPIVGYDANGSTLVYDVNGGTIDAY